MDFPAEISDEVIPQNATSQAIKNASSADRSSRRQYSNQPEIEIGTIIHIAGDLSSDLKVHSNHDMTIPVQVITET